MTARYLGLDYLPAFLIVRLVAVRAVLAYTNFGPPIFARAVASEPAPPPPSRGWLCFAVS